MHWFTLCCVCYYNLVHVTLLSGLKPFFPSAVAYHRILGWLVFLRYRNSDRPLSILLEHVPLGGELICNDDDIASYLIYVVLEMKLNSAVKRSFTIIMRAPLRACDVHTSQRVF